MDQKKEKELLYIRLFKERFADFPAGEIVPHEMPPLTGEGFLKRTFGDIYRQ